MSSSARTRLAHSAANIGALCARGTGAKPTTPPPPTFTLPAEAMSDITDWKIRMKKPIAAAPAAFGAKIPDRVPAMALEADQLGEAVDAMREANRPRR
jgi:hypothetical protein